MTNPTAYFWKDKEVVPHYGHTYYDGIPEDLHNRECVDVTRDDPLERYGYYIPDEWIGKPKEVFDPEFQMHLLLMGVP